MTDNADLKKFVVQVVDVLPQVIRGFLRTQGNALSRGQITLAQYFVLDAVDRQGALRMGELAAELAVSLPAMSGMVNRMYKMKLVKRIFPEKDRRIIKIDLTAGGKNILKTIREQRQAGYRKIFGKLSQKDRQEYLRIITKMRDILNEQLSKQR